MHSQGNNTPQAIKVGSIQRHKYLPILQCSVGHHPVMGLSSAAGFVRTVKEKVFQAALATRGGFLWKVTAGLTLLQPQNLPVEQKRSD